MGGPATEAGGSDAISPCAAADIDNRTPSAPGRANARPRPCVPAVLTTQAIKFTTTARLGFRRAPRTPLRHCSRRRRSRRKGESRMLNVRWRKTGLRCCAQLQADHALVRSMARTGRPRPPGNRRMVRTRKITLRSWHSSAQLAHLPVAVPAGGLVVAIGHDAEPVRSPTSHVHFDVCPTCWSLPFAISRMGKLPGTDRDMERCGRTPENRGVGVGV
jgi:hypothetical protein